MRAFQLGGMTALAMLVLANIAQAGPIGDPKCVSDLAGVDKSFARTLDNLQRAQRADVSGRCAALRSHIDVLKQASGVFARCTADSERSTNISQMDGTISDTREMMATSNCQ